MPDIWLISDTHFSHEKMMIFKRDDGSPLRPFANADEMDEILIENWNRVVKPQDKIYHLGDVAIKDKGLKCLERCNGHKRLIRGNHDIFKTRIYSQFFEQIYGVRVLDKFIMSHIPIHPESLSYRFKYNVHGHLHANHLDDKRYINISVENTNYSPVHIDEIHKRITDMQV